MTAVGQGAASAAVPSLHHRIRHDLEQKILSGEWPPGHHVPSEHALMGVYACSRMTVNKVLSALAGVGLIERRRRVGSCVARPRAQSAVLRIPDLRAVIEARGERYGYELIDRCQRAASREDQARLGLARRGPVLALRCRHLADGVPFAVEDRLLNLREVPEAMQQDFSAQPPNAWLIGHVPWTEAEHRITAWNADRALAAALEIAEGTACLIVERRTWWTGEAITAVRIAHPGHLYDLVARFTPTGAPRPGSS